MQFLSEPSGGSDLAGCRDAGRPRDGDVFVLNGSKIWSSAAFASDYALCLARTDWDVPKHRGLTMFIVQIHQPGIRIDQHPAGQRLRGVLPGVLRRRPHPRRRRGRRGQRRLDGRLPAARPRAQRGRRRVALHRAASRWGPRRSERGPTAVDARPGPGRAGRRGTSGSWWPRRTSCDLVHDQLTARGSSRGWPPGAMSPPAGSILKLCRGHDGHAPHRDRPASSPAMPRSRGRRTAADGRPADRRAARCGARALSLGGGSNEIQRNIISERVLGMPREYAADREHPVPRRAPQRRD